MYFYGAVRNFRASAIIAGFCSAHLLVVKTQRLVPGAAPKGTAKRGGEATVGFLAAAVDEPDVADGAAMRIIAPC
jgi:hypothetical protein